MNTAIIPLTVTLSCTVWMVAGNWHVHNPIDGIFDRFMVGALLSGLVWCVWGVVG